MGVKSCAYDGVLSRLPPGRLEHVGEVTRSEPHRPLVPQTGGPGAQQAGELAGRSFVEAFVTGLQTITVMDVERSMRELAI